jgi:hypothetical protein
LKKIFLIAVISATVITANAQNESAYRSALGIRLGSTVPAVKSGVTYKQFIGSNKALEAIVSFGDGVTVCGLYQIHKSFGSSSENIQWLYGFGGYVGIGNKEKNFGGAGIIGLDYKFKEIPLNLTLDWKPELNIVSKIGFEASGIGLSARFTF